MNNPPAGWYQDPNGSPGQQRWWDGGTWGEHVQQAQPAAAPAPAQPIKRSGTRPWAWITLGVVALIVVIAAALPSNNDTSPSGNSGVNLKQVAPSPSPAPAAAPVPQAPMHFSGSGTENLGTIKLAHDSIVRWTDHGSCCGFSLDNLASNDINDPSLDVRSNKSSGESVIDAGTYHHVEADGGDWTVDITAK